MMIPSLKEVQRLNKYLKENSFSLYRDLLLSVLRDYSHIKELGFARCEGLIRAKRYDLLYVEADSMSARSYSDATLHLVANQFATLVRKYPWDSKLVCLDPERNARETFMKSEHRCKRFNSVFDLYSSFRSPHESMLAKCRDFIHYVIGETPSLPQIYGECDFGPGASLGCHGDATSFGRKIVLDELTVTPGAIPYAMSAWMSHDQLRDRFFERRTGSSGLEVSCVDFAAANRKFAAALSVVQYNKVSFVPKTAKTFRAIAVEPTLNSFVQKGIDQVLRHMLRRAGLDLSDQSENQRMARYGSIDDSEEGFCTIDLSSASDSMSISLVRYLLPRDWFNLLNRSRSPSYIDGGEEVRYHKFCSMGNGFCFPLQTLIFASIAHAVGSGKCGRDFRVYGDDIVVRKKHFEEVVSALKICGFTPNLKKTFSEGAFRESCGADWYAGEDVRPYTLDHKLDSLQNVFKFLNLSRRSNRTSMVLASGFHIVLNVIPGRLRFWRPHKGQPDSGIDPLDYNSPSNPYIRRSKKTNMYRWVELCTLPIQDNVLVPTWGVYAAALRGHDSSCMFTFRRMTKTTLRYVSYSGVSANHALMPEYYYPKGARCNS